MALLRWFAGLFRAVVWLAVHLAISTGLFLASAAFATQPDPDARSGMYVFRVLGSFWLFLAVWHFVVRGVLGRPPAVADRNRKPTGAEMARSSLGCLAWLVPVAATYVYVGRVADWAWAGIRGEDVRHPARQAADRALALGVKVGDQPEVYLPYAVGVVIGFAVINTLIGMALASRPMTPRAAQRTLESRGQPAGGRRRGRRDDVAAANAAALEGARAIARAREGGMPAGMDPGLSPARVAAGRASAAAVGAAHAGAHAREADVDTGARANSGIREDAVLGALTWSSSDRAWWAHRGGEGFPVRIDGAQDGPSARQVELARAVAQRSFEVLLRGSEAARPAALARGVGLPRFLIASAVVGAEARAATPVTLYLRCDGAPGTDFAVRSVDGLHTFEAT